MENKMEAFLRGRHFKKLLDKRFSSFREKYDLKQVEVDILVYIFTYDKVLTSKDICCNLLLNKGQVSQAIESLQMKEYISFVPNGGDKRFVFFEITPKAKEIVKEVIATRKQMKKLLFNGVDDEEMAMFLKVSEKISKNMDALIEADLNSAQ